MCAPRIMLLCAPSKKEHNNNDYVIVCTYKLTLSSRPSLVHHLSFVFLPQNSEARRKPPLSRRRIPLLLPPPPPLSMSTSSMSSIPFLSLPNPKLTFSSFRPLSFSSSSSSSSFSSSSFSCSSFSKHSNGQRSNQKLSIFACSTSPFIGRVGLQRRQGNASMLSFGINPNDLAHTGKNSNTDSSSSSLSHILSATLPFVVAATAIAALAQPSTFTWWVPRVFDFCMWFCALSSCFHSWVYRCLSFNFSVCKFCMWVSLFFSNWAISDSV